MRFNISLIDKYNYIKKFFPNYKISSLKKNLISCGHCTLAKYPILNKKNLSISLLLTNEDEMWHLNKEFRKIDKSTDVLSFPSENVDYKLILNGLDNNKLDKVELINTPLSKIFKNKNIYLGDLAFSCDNLMKYAEQHNKNFIEHFYFMFIHSLLHLLGFDHKKNLDAKLMKQEELQAMKNFIIFNL